MGKYEALVERLREINNINNALAVLSWDQQTGMPPGGAEARARQMGTLARIGHEMFTDEATGKLLDEAENEVDDVYESDAVSMLRVVRKDYAEATRLPTAYVSEFTQLTALAHEIWAKARAASDFAAFAPTLEKLVEMAHKGAEYLGYEEHPYDALLGRYEPGMTTRRVGEIFDAHRPALTNLIARISAAPQVDDSPVRRRFEQDKQREFGLMVIQKMGFDMQRGVQAVSVHPFCTNFSVNDVRITTRFEDDFLNPALFGMIHEAGHAMYEQGVAQRLDGTPLGGGTSLGVHESQSRMWENIVGRSRGFWSWALPQLKATFPQLSDVSEEAFYRAVNKVERSFIRVEADEATYNLHIILRFEIEKDLLTGKLAVKDLPRAWNERFEAYLGVVPPNDALGCLQDVHWSAGLMGYFPTYALGNLLSVQYYTAAVAAHPEIPSQIARGEFGTLREWLGQNIHQHGRKFTAEELTQRITGGSIDPTPYVRYLETKFADVYGL
jgi:carboxypeptidase Taq